MRSVRLLAVRLRHHNASSRNLCLLGRASPVLSCPTYHASSFTSSARPRDAIRNDDDDPSADAAAATASQVNNALFYDAFFAGTDEPRPKEKDKRAREVVVQDTHAQTMTVVLGGRGRLIRKIQVELPDEMFEPDRGDRTLYHDYTEAVFNRFALPDEGLHAYEWESMVLQCETRLHQWIARGREMCSLASYPGLAIPPIGGQTTAWLADDRSGAANALAVLDQEVELFNQESSVTLVESTSRAQLAEVFVRFLTHFMDSRYHVEAFGTTDTGSLMPFSDVNIRIRRKDLAHSIAPFSDEETTHAHEMMSAIADLFRDMPEVKDVHLFTEPVPEVEFIHNTAQVKFRITSYKSAGKQARYLKALRRRHPHFNALYRLLRSTLHLRQLTNPRTGGITSYTLRAMIAAWHDRGRVPETAADQLISFLAFWSKLNTTKYGVCGATGHLFMKHSDESACSQFRMIAQRRGDVLRAAQWDLCSRRTPYPWLLCLQNPSFRSNDLGKYAYAIKHVLRTFEYLSIKLEKGLTALDQGEQIEGNLLDPFVGPFGKQLAASKGERMQGFQKVFDIED